MNQSKPIKNAMWIIGCRIVRAVLNLVVTMFTARFLGPSNYGLINYAASVVAFAAPFMLLGLNTTLVKELVDDPEHQGTTLGTAIGLNLVSSLLCMAGVAAFAVVANPGEKETWIVCVLYSLNLPAQALEMIQYWYQANLKAKYISLSGLCGYVLISVYKIYLLISGKSLYWFAVANALDYLFIALVLHLCYKYMGGRKLHFSLNRGKQMLQKSRYYIVSALMITVFAQTDKIMLKMMLGETAVGYYSAAVTCAGMTGFVFSAIIDTARPIVLEARKHSRVKFQDYVSVLYMIIIYLALAQSIVLTGFAYWVINVLYGAQYQPAVSALRIIVWYTAFSYLGSARTVWILGEEKHSVLWRVNLCGAVANVVLNYFLIPVWGAEGAALASLLTQIFTNFIIGFIMPELRENNRLILQALDPRRLLTFVRKTAS